MTCDGLGSSQGNPFDVEAMEQFWMETLNRIKAYAEAAEQDAEPSVDATARSTLQINHRDGSSEGNGGSSGRSAHRKS
jgi:hypothetical protein